MNDVQILTFGTAVSLIAIACVWVCLRERWDESMREAKAKARTEGDETRARPTY